MQINDIFLAARTAKVQLTLSFYPDIPYTIARAKWKFGGLSIEAERVDTTHERSPLDLVSEVWEEVAGKLTIAQAINEAPL